MLGTRSKRSGSVKSGRSGRSGRSARSGKSRRIGSEESHRSRSNAEVMKDAIGKFEERLSLDGDNNEHVLSTMMKMKAKLGDQMLMDPDKIDPQ